MSDPNPALILLGAGGHAKVVVDALRSAGVHGIHGALDADVAKHGRDVLGVRVLGGDDILERLVREGVARFAMGFVGEGGNGGRREAFRRASSLGLRPATVVHARAVVSPHATLGEGAQVLAGAVVNAGARVGANAIVNSGAVVEHDCVVADHAHVAPGAVVLGGVAIGEGAYVGAGAVVRQTLRVGAEAVVAAGAVVVADVPDKALVVGVPAREVDR